MNTSELNMSESGSSKKPRLDPNLRDFLEELECPVCREYMAPPISMCVSGHSVCKTCRRKLKKCRLCTKHFVKSRNLTLEKLVGKMKYPCKYEALGCTELFSLEHLALHQENCPHNEQRCPLEVIKTNMCTWKGTEDAVMDHMKTNHSYICTTLSQSGKYKTRLRDIENNQCWCRAFFMENDVFLWCTKLIENHMYSCLVYLGVMEEAASFMYRMTINTMDKTGCMTYSHRTCPYPNNMDKIFQNCDCLIFHHDFVKRCVDAEKCLMAEIEIFRPVQSS